MKLPTWTCLFLLNGVSKCVWGKKVFSLIFCPRIVGVLKKLFKETYISQSFGVFSVTSFSETLDFCGIRSIKPHRNNVLGSAH